MSTEAVTPEKQAYDRIMEGVYHPVFFNKLAQGAIVPGSDREAKQLLYLGDELFAIHQQRAGAEAEKQGSFLDFACARLDSLREEAPAYSDLQVKQATAQLMADPTIAAAAPIAAAALRQYR